MHQPRPTAWLGHQRAANHAAQPGNKTIVAAWQAFVGVQAQRVERAGVIGLGQPGRPVGHRGQLLVPGRVGLEQGIFAQAAVARSAGPAIVLRALGQTGAYRIAFDIAQRRP